MHYEAPQSFLFKICAGFAGVEEFDFWQSGVLLALNTFGSFLIHGLALPLVCLPAALQHQSSVYEAAPSASGGEAAPSDSDAGARQGHAQVQQPSGQPSAPVFERQAPAHDAGPCFWRDLRTAAIVFMTVGTLNAAVATASAAIQRRHLMVWALFAPKFLFDACILLVCDAAVLAGVAVALLIFRRS